MYAESRTRLSFFCPDKAEHGVFRNNDKVLFGTRTRQETVFYEKRTSYSLEPNAMDTRAKRYM